MIAKIIFVVLFFFLFYSSCYSEEFSEARKGNLITITNSGMTHIASGPGIVGVTGSGKTSGKWYWELTLNQWYSVGGIGITTDSFIDWSINNGLTGWSPYGLDWIGNGIYHNGSIAWGYACNNDAVYDEGGYAVAMDLDNDTIRFFKNGYDCGIAYTGLPDGYWFPQVGGNTRSYTINLGKTPFTHNMPTGFSPYDGNPDDFPYIPIINAECGTSEREYGYNETVYTGTFCDSGTLSGSVSFPANGSGSTWICTGSGGGIDTNCSATRQDLPPYCQSPAPSGGHIGALTYSPLIKNQGWIFSQIGFACSYTCLDGYTGSGCVDAPLTLTGATTDTGFWGSFANPIYSFFEWIKNFLSGIFSIKENPGPYGIVFSGAENPISINMENTVACGIDIIRACETGVIHSYVGSSGEEAGKWQYSWRLTPPGITYCPPNYIPFSSGYIDISNMIDEEGEFNYLRNKFGEKISTEQIIGITENYSIEVKSKYDIEIFGGISIQSLVNDSLYVAQEGLRYTIRYFLGVTKNILDIIAVFFLKYQDSIDSNQYNILNKKACFLGDIFTIKDTITETKITKTENRGGMDFIILMILAFYSSKYIRKRI